MIVMQYVDFRFNPERDKTAVSETGGVDLRAALVNSCIPAGVVDTDESYNGISEPASILGKPRDVFEAMEMQSHINTFQSPEKDNKDD